MKDATLAKVRKQLAGVSALADFWLQTVQQEVAQMAMTPRWTTWVDTLLLPLRYWKAQLARTRCPAQKAQIARVLQALQEAFERHPCTGQLTPEVLTGWQAWAGEHARAFQRTSSAVEGRNGYLPQDAPQPSWVAHASLPGVDRVAQLRLSCRGRDDTGRTVLQAGISRSL